MAHDELVALYDDDGHVVGSVPRSVMRAENLRHAASSVVVRDGVGRIYLHRRTTTKDVYPGLLDFAAGGVVLAGEDPALGAVREAEEELGVTGVPLEPVDVADYGDDATRYRAFRYVVTYDGPIRWQPEEVSWGEWLTVEELVRRLDDEPATIVPDSVSVWGDTIRRWASERVELPHGWDSTATVVEGRWVDRVPRRPEVAEQLLSEALLLPRIANALPLEVPRPVVLERDPLRVRHHIVRGEPATPSLLTRDDGTAIARFLTVLHATDLPLVTEVGYPSAEDDHVDRAAQVERFRADVFPLVPLGLAEPADLLMRRVVVVGDQAFCHADLVPEHVLVRDGHASGVIDWGDARVTDPARDLAWALNGASSDFAAGVAQGYPVDEALRDRSRAWWALAPWFDVHRGVFLSDEAQVARSLPALVERLTWWGRSGV